MSKKDAKFGYDRFFGRGEDEEQKDATSENPVGEHDDDDEE